MSNNSTVTIKGLTRVQANVLAIMFEKEDMTDVMVEELESLDLSDEIANLKSLSTSVDFGEDEVDVDHVVEFR